MVESKFKITDIGNIPEDWDLVNWNDVFDFKSTASYSRAEIKLNGDIGYIHYGDIHTKIKATLDINNFVSGYISNKQVKTYSLIKEGDLVMADASEDQLGIGKSFEVINSPKKSVISGLHTFLIREKKSSIVANGFKGYFHFNPLMKKQYDSLVTGLKVYSLSKGSFQHIQIPLPPLSEQQEIAKVLMETDAWIDSFENLIAKKRQVKQGTLQALLTPNENWELKKLGGISEIIIGLTYSPKDVRDYGKLVLRSSNIQKGKLSFENNVFVEMDLPNRVIVKENDLLVCVRNGSKQLIGKCALIDKSNEGNAFGAFMTIIRSPYNKYIHHYFSSNHIQNQIDENLGATINQLTNATLKSFEIYFPKSVKEQSRIANMLSDMDTEIDCLEKKLFKAKRLKQGLMQQLLTGKTRLVNTLQTS